MPVRATYLHPLRWAAPFALLLALPAESANGQAGAEQPPSFTEIPAGRLPEPAAPARPSAVQFIGARSFSPEELREPLAEQLQDIEQRGLTRPRADDAAYYLATFYRKQGFASAEVDWDIRGSRLILRIKEGPRTYLERVIFRGNRTFTNDTLYEYLIGATEERLQREPLSFPFVEADMETGASRIRGLYESEGFLNVVVGEPKISFNRSRSRAAVMLNITEGPRYGFGSFTFTGSTLFPHSELIEGLGEPVNEPYTAQRVSTMERNLEYFYKSRGYFKAQVEAFSDPAQARRIRVAGEEGRVYDRVVPVRFSVQPGELYRFNGVTATGLDRLKPSFIQNRFADLKGEVYDPAKLDETFRELLQTGLFQNLRINSVPQPDNTIRLDLSIEEAKQKEFGFSVGFSNYEGLILGIRLADRNFMRNGRPLSLEIENSLRGLGAELLYIDPWWLESDFSLRLRAYAQGREETGYSKRESGVRADLLRDVTKNIELGVFLQAENVEITESIIGQEFLGLTSYQIGTFGFTQSYDFRDHPLNPTKGWIINTALDVSAIAGELAFGRATVRLSYYLPLGDKFLLAFGARGGLVYPWTSVPIDERYFSGGGTTVRSFAERELGPKDTAGNPIGGEAFTTFNVELEFPIKDAFRGALFIDAGNLSLRLQDAGVEEMRYAIGAGLRYKLPIGPVRLDVGINPNPRNFEDWGAVHFSFGFAF